MIKIEPKSKGRGRGLKHLKEIAKQTPRPPKAFLEETASVQNVHAKADDANANVSVQQSNIDVKSSLMQENVQETDKKQPIADGGMQNKPDPKAIASAEGSTKIVKEGKEEDKTVHISESDKKQLEEKVVDAKGSEETVATFDERLVKNVDCPAFVPKGNLNVNAAEFRMPINESFMGQEQYPVSNNSKETATEIEEDDFVIGLFQDTVNGLTLSPGDYDRIIDNLLETMSMFISKQETMKTIVGIIIEQAIQSQNFLYTAVRLIKIFLEKLEIKFQDSEISFKRAFYPSLEGIFKEMPHLMMDRENPESQSRACGMAMLFADLLCNIKTGSQLNKVFLKAVFQTIKQLQEDPTKEMVLTLIKILKLTGPTLDANKALGEGIPEVDEMFSELSDLSLGTTWLSNLDNCTELRQRFFAIFKLHSRNWDREPVEEIEVVDNVGISSSSSQHDDHASSVIDWTEYCEPEDFEPKEEYDDDYESFLRATGQI